MTKEEITDSLRQFKNRRDAVLHEDIGALEHCLKRFVKFCNSDPLVRKVIDPISDSYNVDIETWWDRTLNQDEGLHFPDDRDEELLVRFKIMESAVENRQRLHHFGVLFGKRKSDDWKSLFRSLVVRPFADELSHRLGDAANMAAPEARDLQAVSLDRIPASNETRIFLSHKSVDQPIVRRYYDALSEIGFNPWLDDPDMPAGANLHREILKGFQESCAAVFFITENFEDEKYLATEVDYAIDQKHEKEEHFSIITLRYPNAARVPDLLRRFIWKDIEDDLEGYREIVRALPIELGPVRWKEGVVE